MARGRLLAARRVWGVALAAAIMAALAFALREALAPRAPPPAAVAPTAGEGAVVALGWLEPGSRVVRVAPPTQAEPARVRQLLVDEGDTVAIGQRLAVLESEPARAARWRTARAEVALRQRLLERARAQTGSEETARAAALRRAEFDVAVAAADLERTRSLAAVGFVADSYVQRERLRHEVARAAAAEAAAALRRTQSAFDGDGVPVDIAVAERELHLAHAVAEQVAVELEQSYVHAPIGGRVLRVRARDGEAIGAEGLLDLGDVRTMVARAEVYETDRRRLSVGQAARVDSAALGAPLAGVVERIGERVERQSALPQDPVANSDGRVIHVWVRLDPESSARVTDMTFLQVRVRFAP